MEQQAGNFTVTVSDISQLAQPESETLTLLWIMEGSVELHNGKAQRTLGVGRLAIINRGHSWSLSASAPNAVMILTLTAAWLTALDGDFFSCEYAVSSHTREAEERLRQLMRQLLAVTLIGERARSTLEANRWLSEIILLLASCFSLPIAARPRRDADGWSPRVARVVARIAAGYQQRLTLRDVAAAEFVSEAWLSRQFHKEVGISFIQFLTATRLEKAAAQILTTRKSIQHIAQEQGFASPRIMSDLFKRQYGVTPRRFRQRHPAPERPRARGLPADAWRPVPAERLYRCLNQPEEHGWDRSPVMVKTRYVRTLDVSAMPDRAAPLRHNRIVVTLRELDDLLRKDVRRDLERLHAALPVYGVDISEPFLSSRLFSAGWDDAQMAGYASWYNLQEIFSWLAEKGWIVILHTGLTTRRDLFSRFLQLARERLSPSTLTDWRFVWHWSPQADEPVRQRSWRQQREALNAWLPQPPFGIWHRFPAGDAAVADDPLFTSPLFREADFLATQADANELLDLSVADSGRLASSENYPVQKIRQIHSALRQHRRSLPLWILSWNTLTGNTRTTNGRFFRGSLLLDNLAGMAEQAWLMGFWLNSGLQGETRDDGKLETSSLALFYNHSLPRPIYWVLWLWLRLHGEVLVNDKHLLLLRHGDRYQLLLRNTVVFNPWLSDQETFIQRFDQPFSVRLQGIGGRWRIKQHLFDRRHGALFPLLETFRSQTGPDEEEYQWLRHQARPALCTHQETTDAGWHITGSLSCNALALYELTPLDSAGGVE
jgi:beta-xylosidase/AraC-like DNA-binding protein